MGGTYNNIKWFINHCPPRLSHAQETALLKSNARRMKKPTMDAGIGSAHARTSQPAIHVTRKRNSNGGTADSHNRRKGKTET
jgi:hypothetical protein